MVARLQSNSPRKAAPTFIRDSLSGGCYPQRYPRIELYAGKQMSTLLDELNEVLKWHAGTKESLDQFFNRALHERVSNKRLPKGKHQPGWETAQLSEAEVIVCDELWTLEELLQFSQWHERAQPARTNVPVVVFRGWGQRCLIDGQTRINRWRKLGDTGPHRVLVVEPVREVMDPFPGREHSRLGGL